MACELQATRYKEAAQIWPNSFSHLFFEISHRVMIYEYGSLQNMLLGRTQILQKIQEAR